MLPEEGLLLSSESVSNPYRNLLYHTKAFPPEGFFYALFMQQIKTYRHLQAPFNSPRGEDLLN